MFHVRYSVKKSRRWEEAGFEKEKKRVYCTIRMIFYILIFICSFIFYSKYPVFFFNHRCYCVEGGNKVGSAFVKPWDEYMY